MISADKIDKRHLTNAERAAMGLPLKGFRGLKGNRGARHQKIYPLVKMFETSPEVRLAEQLRVMLGKWAERGIR